MCKALVMTLITLKSQRLIFEKAPVGLRGQNPEKAAYHVDQHEKLKGLGRSKAT